MSESESVRVLHVFNALRPSGGEEMVRVAVPLWRDLGVQTHVLSTGACDGPYVAALAASGAEVSHLPFVRSISFVRSVHRIIRGGGFDVVHIHPERADVLYAIAARFAGVKTIIRTVHHLFEFTGALRLREVVSRGLSRHVLGVQFITSTRANVLNERLRFRNRASLVPLWIDDSLFGPPSAEEREAARAALGIGPSERVVVSVGGCADYKNHDGLLRALASMPDHRRPTYVHVGQEHEGWPERALASDLGIGSSCRFLGILPSPLAALHAADAFAMPSSVEGFGIAAVEALACGLPSLLGDVPAMNELRSFLPGNPDIIWVAPQVAAIREGLEELFSVRRPPPPAGVGAGARAVFGADAGARRYARFYGRPRAE